MNDDSQKSTCFAFLSFASDLFASVVVDSNFGTVSFASSAGSFWLLVLGGTNDNFGGERDKNDQLCQYSK